MLKIIGRCKLNTEKIRNEVPKLIQSECDSRESKSFAHIYDLWGKNQKSDEWKFACKGHENTFKSGTDTWVHKEKVYIQDRIDGFLEKFDEMIKTADEYDLTFKCFYLDDAWAFVLYGSTPDTCWMFPADCVELEAYINYDSLGKTERKLLMSGKSQDLSEETSLSDIGTSIAETKAREEKVKDDMTKLQAEIKDVEEAKTNELAKLQEEIDRKIAELEEKKKDAMSVLEKKKAEMEEKLADLGKELYMLDSEIYAIRCYTGEIVEVKQIREGKPATEDTPLIMHQKMRYLDEELGKIASIYDIDFSDAGAFEKILEVNDLAFTYFTPDERCFALVRVSRTNKTYHNHDEYNMLETYRKLHGEKVAMLLRDGENLYIAWTDDERIYFSDEAFLKPGERELNEHEERELERGQFESDADYEKRMRERQERSGKEQLGRYFVFSILQGILDRGMIKFPEKVNIGSKNPYIVFSFADGRIATNEYGTFGDMIKLCNSSVRKGDMILTMQYLHQESGRRYSAWNNDRGRGEKNRAHDVSVSNCTIYPINMVEDTAQYTYTITATDRSGREYTRTSELTDAERKNMHDGFWIYSDFREEPGTRKHHYFVSLEKSENWETGKRARANFEVYPHEFINLTFMNSVWLEYILSSQKTEGINIGGSNVDFAYLIPYLKKALEFVRKREGKVAEWIRNIDGSVLEDPKWSVKLSEWMVEHDVHVFSEYQAKRFCKAYSIKAKG